MAQLVVSAAGALIGNFIAPGIGAQIGWVAGSMLGSALFGGQSQKGPRLSETRVQVSSYGAAIPIAYGGVRLAGNVIWSTDLVETSSEVGGKGGPSVTSYAYSVSCAVAICEGPIGGIRRVWADAKLVYDAREDADAATQAASASFANYMTVHLGSETQMPDATIEAAEGAGTVEAYRGVAYVVFTDLPLGNYGNRIPNFSFEITNESPQLSYPTLLEPLRVYPWSGSRPVHSVGDTNYTMTAPPFSSGTDFESIALANATAWAGDPVSYVAEAGSSYEWMGIYRADNTSPYLNIDTDQLARDPEFIYYALGVEPEGTWDIDSRVGVVPDGIVWGDFDLSLELAENVRYLQTESGSNLYVTRRATASLSSGGPAPEWPFEANSASGIVNPDAGDYYAYIVSAAYTYHVVDLSAKRIPTHSSKSCYVGNPCAAAEGAAELPGNPDFCLSCEGEVTPNYTWTIVSGTAKVLCDVEYRDNALYQNALGPVLLPGDPDYSNAAFWSAARDAAVSAGRMQADVSYPVVVSSYASGEAPVAVSIGEGSALLADVVADLCMRAGLEAGEIDVSQLVDEVRGYIVPRQMPARSAIEPLSQAFGFDAVESGEQIVFVKRGAAPVATIPQWHLGAGASQRADEAAVTTTRQQESELPAEVSIAYCCREADYQTGVQRALRVTTGSQQVLGIEMPLVMSDQEAANVAEVLLYDAWAGRAQRSFSTTVALADLRPTDVVEVDDGEFRYRGRLVEKSEAAGVIRWLLRDEVPVTFVPNAAPSLTAGGGGAVTLYGPLWFEMMDLPALRDQDDDAGFYVAATSFAFAFRGGYLYRSADDENFLSLLEMRVPGVVGHASTALPAWTGGNVWDEVNEVTVVVHDGTLSSATRTQVLNGSNAALLGQEIMQFRDAQLVAPKTYRLSGLLRGRRGTEDRTAGHTATDRFVLLDERNVYRVPQSVAQLGPAYYRGVVYGGATQDAASVPFTNTGEALRPLAPVHLAATPRDDGGADVRWVRRSRIRGAWSDGADVPLGEESESYRVRLLDVAGATLHEQVVSSPAATVPAGGAAVQVAQISAVVGAGHPATLSIA